MSSKYIPEDRCHCPNPDCNGQLTMKQIKMGIWRCDDCGGISKWSWTR